MEIINIIKNLYDIAGFYILWIIIHYVAANLYSTFCAEKSIIGFIKFIIVSQALYCVDIRWIIYKGGNVIYSLWMSIGLWVATKLLHNLIISKKFE